jgi:hypothetical protein
MRMAALLAVCVISLSSCTFFLHTMTYDKTLNIFTDKKTGIKYTDAPSCYEPVQLGDEYAKWKISGENVIFYEVKGMDPRQWLAEEGKTIFYAEDITLPGLRELAPVGIYICVEEDYSIALVEITDADDIQGIINLWENGEALSYPGITPEATYRLKFLSEKYPGIYYNLIYVKYSDGTAYLYSRDSGRCVVAGDIVESYIGG